MALSLGALDTPLAAAEGVALTPVPILGYSLLQVGVAVGVVGIAIIALRKLYEKTLR